jgi:hypothetical protein
MKHLFLWSSSQQFDFKILAWSKILPHVINAKTSGILFSTFEEASISFTHALDSLWTVSLHLGSGSCLMITNCCPCKLHSDSGFPSTTRSICTFSMMCIWNYLLATWDFHRDRPNTVSQVLGLWIDWDVVVIIHKGLLIM